MYFPMFLELSRIANAPRCILFPLSPFSSPRSHNCKREGNYNLLSMILQIDIPFPLLMNTLLFLVFPTFWLNLNILFVLLLIQKYLNFIMCVHFYLSLHKMCSSLGIYQPKRFHCPPVNQGLPSLSLSTLTQV